MKAILFSLLVILCSIIASAQQKIDSAKLVKPVINNASLPVKLVTAPIQAVTTTSTSPQNNNSATTTTQQKNTAPGSTNTTTPAKTDADYFLSVVTATFKTGNDNKEYPSVLSVYVYCGNMNSGNHHGFLLYGYQNELPKNSSMPLVIEQINTLRKYDAKENTLAAYKQYGLRFFLSYFANFKLDAWKIESISLKLEFKDAAGNPHPTMGQKVISFSDSNLWMDGFDKVVTFYKTDSYFNSLPVKQSSYKNFYEN
ncbi:MAG: hypothetical protein QM726_08895 [Chitinophagaceae bacterium]